MKGTPVLPVSLSSITGNQTRAPVLLDCPLFAFCDQTLKLLSSITAPGAIYCCSCCLWRGSGDFPFPLCSLGCSSSSSSIRRGHCAVIKPSLHLSLSSAGGRLQQQGVPDSLPPYPPRVKNTALAVWIAGDTCWLGGGSASGKSLCTFYLQKCTEGCPLALDRVYLLHSLHVVKVKWN